MTSACERWLRGAERLAVAGISSARLDARVLLAHVMRLGQGEWLPSHPPTPDDAARFQDLIERRVKGEPVAYIVGEREFWSLPFAVGPGVLVPRPETETLIEEALRAFPDRNTELEILDLGTGSGCLLITLLKAFPHARGKGVESSAKALGWARLNAERLCVSDRCIWYEGDWKAVRTTANLVVANPPYLSENDLGAAPVDVRQWEPQEALLGGSDGLEAYRSLAGAIGAVLSPSGRAFVEIGAGQADRVSAIFHGEDLEIASVVPDLAGVPRCLSVVKGRR